MKNNQSKKNNQYRLPRHLFYRMVYLVKDYERMKIEISTVLGSEPNKSTFPNPEGEEMVRIKRIIRECNAVDSALKMIPPEYHSGIINKICRNEPYPVTADPSVFKCWKGRFLYYIAENLFYI